MPTATGRVIKGQVGIFDPYTDRRSVEQNADFLKTVNVEDFFLNGRTYSRL